MARATKPKSDENRIPRKDRRGFNPVAVGLVLVVVIGLIVYFGFTKSVPFTHGFRVNAVFENANSIRKNSPVRIAGVNVGKVTKIERYKDTNASVVTLELQDKALPIHKDATAKIRRASSSRATSSSTCSRARRARRCSATATRCR